MIDRVFNHPAAETARRWLWAITDRVSFLVESACVANLLFWGLTFAALSFSWDKSAHEWGSFWTHYAAASADRRAPVEVFGMAAMAVLTVGVAWIRFPKSKACWAAWPKRERTAEGACRSAQEHAA